jgi:uncharacterized protein YndB with AHSA1/START domain
MTAAASSVDSAATQVEWADGDLVLVRVFPAPRELVFAAWTTPEHFARWWGPHGSTLQISTMDVRTGGALHYRHRFPDYPDVWIGGEYREVRAPERIAFTTWFTDEAGARVERTGFPAEMTITITFAPHPDGTRVTARHAGLVADQGEVQGWTESLDRLASLLAESHTPTGADR